jgi:uncharacterized protein (TIGR03437 family)
MAFNQDGSLNGSSNPAARGSFVSLFGTGQGAISPPLVSGQLASLAEPFNRVVSAVSVNIGSLPADLAFAGMAPGLAGVFQINARVPLDSPTGAEIPIELTIAGTPTGQAATLTIQ